MHAPPAALPSDDQAHFFDRVKHTLENRETYNEFLKVVNLFTQDIIDTAFLVKQSRSFLGDGELMRQWREILGWDDRRERESRLREAQEAELSSWARGLGSAVAGVVLERPGRKDLSVRYGSYRKLPPSVSLRFAIAICVTDLRNSGGQCDLLWSRRNVQIGAERRVGLAPYVVQ